MKFSAIAVSVAALFSATALAAPAADTNVEAREVDVHNIQEVAALMARDDLVKRNCTGCSGGWITCCTFGSCYSIRC